MATYFDLWDVDSGNCIGTFRTLAEALAIVVALLEANGDDYADELDLGQIDDERFQLIANGAPLVRLAHGAAGHVAMSSVGGGDR